MNNKRNYYRILQVQPDAPEAIIRASYRTLMQKLCMHPDLGGDTATAILLNQAYETLTDKHKRAAYDRQLQHVLHKQRTSETRQPSQPADHTVNEPPSRCPFCRDKQPRFNRSSGNRSCISCLSPLQLSEKKSTNGQDRRSIFRLSSGGAISFHTTWPQARAFQASVEDLSHNGLKLRCRQQLAPDSILKLFNANLRAIGKVIRCEPDSINGYYRIGIEFITLRFENKTGSFLSAKV